MTIERNGKQIELTEDEMIWAYYEQLHKWDVEYITGNLLDQYDTDDESDLEMYTELRSNTELANNVAYRYRELLEDTYGSDREMECLKSAFDYYDGNNLARKRKERKIEELRKQFDSFLETTEPAIGTYYFEITSPEKENGVGTTGDVHRNDTWTDLFNWLLDDLLEDQNYFGRFLDVQITYMQYDGVDDEDEFADDLA